ncbi:EF-hand domain-containing protein [Sulfuriroseicoccus oceanibius]|uniref:EF-hand domain-containing protein n=1 Tax=Sulfuriroseicoccus oceanibius TaxID=2707525 RepID=A0A6B3L8S0_9BACT|nr:EF-hand domain-containing protein [Sulfuriroseicoccus oceanibius]QQL43860.1 EF-hand domain-containing protein [Sulfuriroseicoccus oceanibius]
MPRSSTLTRIVSSLLACGLMASTNAEPVDHHPGPDGRPGQPPHAGPPRDGRGGPPPHARGKGPHRGPSPERAEMMRRLRAAADLDGDGKLNEAERKQLQEERRRMHQRSKQRLLNRFDKDGDGKLNSEEKAEAKAHAEKRRNEMRQRLIKEFDADGDGKLNETERKAARAAMEERIEKERRQRKRRGPHPDRPRINDRSPDDQRIHPERRRRQMQRFDTNQDGQLDAEERAAMRKARQAKQNKPAEPNHKQPDSGE